MTTFLTPIDTLIPKILFAFFLFLFPMSVLCRPSAPGGGGLQKGPIEPLPPPLEQFSTRPTVLLGGKPPCLKKKGGVQGVRGGGLQPNNQCIPLNDVLCATHHCVLGAFVGIQVHARKAVLGMRFTPDQNRNVPPLRYDWVARLAHDFPDVDFVLNGGVESVAEVRRLAQQFPALKGVMVGRATSRTPWQFAVVDWEVYGDAVAQPGLSRRQVLATYGAYCDERMAAAPPGPTRQHLQRALLKPLYNLFAGEFQGRSWRRALETAHQTPKYRDMPAGQFLTTVSEGVLLPETLDRPPGEARPGPQAETLADATPGRAPDAAATAPDILAPRSPTVAPSHPTVTNEEA